MVLCISVKNKKSNLIFSLLVYFLFFLLFFLFLFLFHVSLIQDKLSYQTNKKNNNQTSQKD
jgi:hypothetical protein